MHAKLIYRTKVGLASPDSSPTVEGEKIKSCLAHGLAMDRISSPFEDGMLPVHLQGIIATRDPQSLGPASNNPFAAARRFKAAGVLKERTNDAHAHSPRLSRTSSAVRADSAFADEENVASNGKPPSKVAAASRLSSVTLPITPLMASIAADEGKRLLNTGKVPKFPLNMRTGSSSRILFKPRPLISKGLAKYRAGVKQSAARNRPAVDVTNVARLSKAIGARQIIDSRRRAVARIAALRVLDHVRSQGRLTDPKPRFDASLAFKAQQLKPRKVDVAKVWESAVKFFEAEHAKLTNH